MAERKCSDRLRELIIRYVIDSVPHGVSSWARSFAVIVCLFLWNFMNLSNSNTRKLCVTKRFLDGWRYCNYTHLVLVRNNPRASRFCYYFKTEELGKEFQGIGSLMDVSSCLRMCKLWFEQKERFKSTFPFSEWCSQTGIQVPRSELRTYLNLHGDEKNVWNVWEFKCCENLFLQNN